MRTLLQDIRFGARLVRKSPGVSALVLVLMALGIGANTAVFGVVNSVLLRPLPFTKPEQLVRVTSDFEGQAASDLGLSAPELFDYRDRAGIFERISGLYPIHANLTGGDGPERVEALLVDVDYFMILGTDVQLGRSFRAEDYDPGIAEVAVISDGLWHRRFGGSPDVVGKTMMLDEDPITIIGVMPPDFRHPGRTLRSAVDIWCPSGWIAQPFGELNRRAYFLSGAIGRLKPGVDLATAEARLGEMASEFRQQYPDAYPPRAGWAPRVVDLHDDLTGETGPVLLMLLAAVGLVLLIACANIANLLLARASARQQEISVRCALGASRGRIVRQLLTESVLLATLGGALGILLAGWITQLLTLSSPVPVALDGASAYDARVFGFCLVVSMLTGLVCGLAPALQTTSLDIYAMLKGMARGSTDGSGRARLRNMLVVAQVALALTLMIAATLLVRSFVRLQTVDPGFDSENVRTAQVWLPQPDIRETGPYFKVESRLSLYTQAIERLGAQPGVQAVGGVWPLPFSDRPFSGAFRIEGRAAEVDETLSAQMLRATPEYFACMNIPVLQGRSFTLADDLQAPRAVIVNEAFVRRYLPDVEPVGKRLRFGGADSQAPWMSIVGVVGNVKNEGLQIDDKPQIYRSVLQDPGASLAFVMRLGADYDVTGGTIEREVRAVDPDLPVYGIRAMDEIVADTTSRQRFATQVLGVLALVALLLSAVGIGGVTSYVTSRRTREIGIRMAHGARGIDVLRLIVGQGAKLIGVGVAIGLLASFAVTRLLQGMLFGVSATDPGTFAIVSATLAATALVACYLPARRATKVDPIVALRDE